MSPSAPAFSKLNEINYAQWAPDMAARLKTLGCWRITNGTETNPNHVGTADAPITDYQRRENRDFAKAWDMAAGELWGCIEPQEQTHVRDVSEDPVQMWTRLKQVHMQQRPGTRFAAYNTLLSLQKEEGETLTKMLGQADDLLVAIKALRPTTFDLKTLDEELVLMAVVRALPVEFQSLRQTLLLDNNLTLAKIRDNFHSVDAAPEPYAPSPSVVAQPAAVATPSSVTCTFCGRTRHSEDQCWTKQKAMKEAQEAAKGRGRRGKEKDAKEAGEDSANSVVSEHYAGHASAFVSTSDRASWLRTRAAADWNTDTGASAHMTPHRSWFRSYSPHIVPIRLADNKVIYSSGLGSIEFQPKIGGEACAGVVFHDVLHVPQLASNLLSVFHLTREKGYACEIQDTSAEFYRGDKLLFDATINERNTGYLNGTTIIPAVC